MLLRKLCPVPVWNQMKLALLSGNIDEALGYFRENIRDTYRAIHESLDSNLVQQVRTMSFSVLKISNKP